MLRSAGILLFRRHTAGLQFLLVHPGGPFWKNKDAAAWSIPKGEFEANEDPLAAAQREFQEETGFAPAGPFLPLTSIRQKSGKTVEAWACEGDCDPAAIHSNTFEMEWPPRSGRRGVFPEVDRAEWFSLDEARQKINPAQAALVNELASLLAG